MKPLRAVLAVIACTATLPSATAASCTVSATSTAFGVYDPQASLALDTTGSVRVTCAPVVVSVFLTYSIALSSGGAGSFAPRRMSAASHQLQYQLYSDALRTDVWGDGSAGTGSVGGGFLLSLLVPISAAHVVYGRIPAGQTAAAAGSYGDTITVTVTY